MTNDPKEWMNEYSDFVSAGEFEVPRALERQVQARVRELLNPSPWTVFAKILGIHTVVGYLSLGICHQFGMNPFGTERSLADWFMTMWGHNTCMIACGGLFLGASILTAGTFLSIEEVSALKRTEFLQSLALGAVSLALFVIFGAEFVLAIFGFWLLGACVGGWLATEAVWKLKRA